MKIGLALPHYDFSFPDHGPVSMARVLDYARRAEEAGLDSVWVSDHLFLDIQRYGGPPGAHRTIEAMTALAAIAATTKRVRLGSLVLCAAFRNADVLALSASTITDLSGGRLELGLGAGWYQQEFDAAGVAFGTPGERVAALEASVNRVRGRAPVWIGSKGGPRLARLVAENADGWNTCWRITPADYAARADVLRAACDAAGRDPSTVRRSVGLYTLIGTDDDDLAERYRALQAWAPGGALDDVTLDDFGAGALVGTLEQCAERVGEFGALGVEEMIVSPASLPFSVYDDEQIELAARLRAMV